MRHLFALHPAMIPMIVMNRIIPHSMMPVHKNIFLFPVFSPMLENAMANVVYITNAPVINIRMDAAITMPFLHCKEQDI
jgi:hypothetical protein